ncbi:hypothetical protein MSAN_02412500 [Mycena sanguinolenta]|uniref:Uncharacterized protein n=1 Tax=Mycena sanguinolenta TaxID=230812 RepID=A0A8H6X376_9AGAR|nr:hypothetical protein MSAN_02412500 [Mycena sanguinolenta]
MEVLTCLRAPSAHREAATDSDSMRCTATRAQNSTQLLHRPAGVAAWVPELHDTRLSLHETTPLLSAHPSMPNRQDPPRRVAWQIGAELASSRAKPRHASPRRPHGRDRPRRGKESASTTRRPQCRAAAQSSNAFIELRLVVVLPGIRCTPLQLPILCRRAYRAVVPLPRPHSTPPYSSDFPSIRRRLRVSASPPKPARQHKREPRRSPRSTALSRYPMLLDGVERPDNDVRLHQASMVLSFDYASTACRAIHSGKGGRGPEEAKALRHHVDTFEVLWHTPGWVGCGWWEANAKGA